MHRQIFSYCEHSNDYYHCPKLFSQTKYMLFLSTPIGSTYAMHYVTVSATGSKPRIGSRRPRINWSCYLLLAARLASACRQTYLLASQSDLSSCCCSVISAAAAAAISRNSIDLKEEKTADQVIAPQAAISKWRTWLLMPLLPDWPTLPRASPQRHSQQVNWRRQSRDDVQ